MPVLAEHLEGLAEALDHAPPTSPNRARATNPGEVIDRRLEWLHEEPPASETDLRATSIAWEHLFARAARKPFGAEDAQTVLTDTDPSWAEADPTQLMRLMDESTRQLEALAERSDDVFSPEAVDEATRAALAVQFSVAQIFASSQIPRFFK